ncbi:MAG: hypothetical protein VX447_04130 [Pseudomonadota bacterium]|uniref:hypothetical protein n=1 Tax=Gallaecimonas pentaromativorans TaxID=584787 RepID=UPI0012ED2D70|nr:hypothetical protein [Gallaecimonas pentaromativorans]MED5523930.1 hypothetical protein [Pseudomonadota bacterium]
MDKTTFVIEPGIGAGPVILGKHRDAIQEAYTYVYSSFFKAQTSKFRSDECELAGFIAHYDLSGNTKHIEIFSGERQVIEYEIFGMKAKNITLSELKKYLSFKGISFEINDYGIKAASIGLSTFNYDLQSDEDIIESFGIFKSMQSA